MPQSSGAWVRMPIWIERSGATTPCRTAGDEGAVVDAAVIVVPGSWWHRNAPAPSDRAWRQGDEQRPGDIMVAPIEISNRAASMMSRACASMQPGISACRHSRTNSRHNRPRQVLERIGMKRILRIAVEDRRPGAPPAVRTRPGHWRRRSKECPDCDIDAGEVARQAPAHEGQHAL